MDENGHNIVIVTGLSGAGKSQALKTLEDVGYFCVDNLPPSLIPTFIDLYSQVKKQAIQIAIVVDIRGGEFFMDLADALTALREKAIRPTVLFLEAEDETLVRRYKETRRRHPLSQQSGILEGIREERQILSDLKTASDIIIDTSNLAPAEFRRQLAEVFSKSVSPQKLLITIISFGFKYGLPMDADLVFDVRFLPNPHYIKELRPLTGLDPKVAEYVKDSPVTAEFMSRFQHFTGFLLPNYVEEGKTHLTIAVGCTGGKHRSVVVGQLIKAYLEALEHTVIIEHRDIDRT